MCVCVCVLFWFRGFSGLVSEKLSYKLIYICLWATLKKWKEKYIYTTYIRRQNTALYTHTHTHTHIHTHRVLHVSTACYHQTPLNIQIFWTAKSYRPISGERILFSLWIALPWRQNHCDPSKWQYLCISTQGIPYQKNWIFSISAMRKWNVASNPVQSLHTLERGSL